MVVHALDEQGCFAWSAGYDGVQGMWVRARPPLTGWGPLFYDKGRKLTPATRAAEPQPCVSQAVLAAARLAAGLR